MPPNKQKLTDEEQQKVTEWLNAHCKDMVCPVCGQPAFQVQSTLGIVQLYGGGTTILGSGYPAIVVICSNCSNMLFVDLTSIELAENIKER